MCVRVHIHICDVRARPRGKKSSRGKPRKIRIIYAAVVGKGLRRSYMRFFSLHFAILSFLLHFFHIFMYASPRESATPARYVFSFFYIHTAHTIICTSAINGIFIKIRLFCNVNFSLLHVRDSTYVCICVSINYVFFSRKNCGHERDEGAVNYPLCVCGYKGKCFSYSRAFFFNLLSCVAFSFFSPF